MNPHHHLTERFLVAGLALVALAVASCSWWRGHPEAQQAVDAVVENGERLCFLVTDDQGEREICSTGADLAQAADAFAGALERTTASREFQACPPVPSAAAPSVTSTPSNSVEQAVP